MAEEQKVDQQIATATTGETISQQPPAPKEDPADPSSDYVSEHDLTNTYIKALKEAIANKEVIKIFDNLLTIATEDGASDIHIEPFENLCRIRIRIDGVLIILVHYPQSIHENIIAKFKIESGQMRPDEKRLPQDARVSTSTLTNKELDLRANTIPTVWGEKLVMRIVDKSKETPPLSVLGIEGLNSEIIMRNINFPNGIIVVTGPTGSGKTTTLYASLDILNVPEVNITTYEDPVEMKMRGLNQSQVRADIGFTFASGLRAALRQDPDIIMVGEIRDFETLQTAMEAAMTGHLVFSTVHTNSAAETVTRVINLGAKPYMVTGTFNVIIAQRLGRKMRDDAKIEVNVKEKYPERYMSARQAILTMKPESLQREMKMRNITGEMIERFMEQGLAMGPDPEKGSLAFKGRVGLYEMLEFDDEIRQMLLEGEKALAVEKYALENKGMINLERDAVFKMIQGKISIEEVYRLVKHKTYT